VKAKETTRDEVRRLAAGWAPLREDSSMEERDLGERVREADKQVERAEERLEEVEAEIEQAREHVGEVVDVPEEPKE
jgi:hypothetical protein